MTDGFNEGSGYVLGMVIRAGSFARDGNVPGVPIAAGIVYPWFEPLLSPISGSTGMTSVRLR